ncbi:MAG TPA: DUF4337 family protein [Lacipirellulaceae bacterium]|jgi:ribosome-binding ATPase YchF (GTP1/OBG family)
MSDDSPTEHLHEDMLERAKEALESWISWAAATAAVLAALAAVTGELSNGRLTQSTRDQVQSNDSWGYYQAKSIKAAVLRGKMEMLAALNKPESEADLKKLEEYEHDLDQLKQQAEHQEATSEASLARHETFERGVTLFHIAIAVVAIAVLMRKQWLWYVSVLAGAIGALFLLRGLYM